jgi:hypothetical protein
LIGRSLVFFVIWLTFSIIGNATAAERDLMGVWQQVSSTGGVCKECTISIARTGDGVRVDASNGWFSHISELPGQAGWRGSGKWTRSKSGQVVARDVTTLFKVSEHRLFLSMRIVEPNGRTIEVKAVFERSVPVA